MEILNFDKSKPEVKEIEMEKSEKTVLMYALVNGSFVISTTFTSRVPESVLESFQEEMEAYDFSPRDMILWENPMRLTPTNKGMAFVPMFPFTDDTIFEVTNFVESDQIVCSYTPVPEIANHYQDSVKEYRAESAGIVIPNGSLLN